MKVECKLKRKGGTKIELFGKPYHFRPEDAAIAQDDPRYMEVPHVAVVEDPNAQHRLCAQIRESYAPLDPAAEIPKPTKTVQQTMAADKAGEKQEAKPVIINDGEGNEINLSELSDEDLRTLAKNEFGISVHHKWANQTVIAKIIEKTRGED